MLSIALGVTKQRILRVSTRIQLMPASENSVKLEQNRRLQQKTGTYKEEIKRKSPEYLVILTESCLQAQMIKRYFQFSSLYGAPTMNLVSTS